MKSKSSSLLFLLLLCTTAAHAQMYKWVAPDGTVSYSDVAPPSNAKQVEKKSLGSSGPSTAGLPYELAEAVRNSPVKLYTATKCPGCDDGRKLLNSRGIPFTEKTVNTNEDNEQLRQVSGAAQLPYLIIGRNKQTGFEAGAWNSALTSAGYPASNQLPKNYSNVVESAAPPKKQPTENQNTKTEATPTAPLSPNGNATPGFRF